MYELKIDTRNIKKILNKQIGNNLSKNMAKGIRSAMYDSGIEIIKTLQQDTLDRNSKLGRLYRIKKGRKTILHRASAEGQTPANITGKYRKSANYTLRGVGQITIGLGVKYGADLEFGTKKNPIIKPRPGLQNSAKKNIRNMVNNVQSQIIKNLRGQT